MNEPAASSPAGDAAHAWWEADLLERFLRYVKIHTTSDPHVNATPSTSRQFELARLLEAELRDFGVSDVGIDDQCYLIARIPGTAGGTPVGLMAHIDTAPDASGENVRPQVLTPYTGGVIPLGSDHALDPAEYPMLRRYEGATVITTDGTTLLGSDDKAGVAEIMAAVRFLLSHPDLPRPPLEIIFTPDEETGRGMDAFPQERLGSRVCYTVDGTDEGVIEAECFTAFKAVVTLTGDVIHPGSARGKLANAVAMAGHYISLLPRSESPEATDGRYGFYCPAEATATMASASITIIVRDFDMSIAERRVAYLRDAARLVEGAFPGGSVSVDVHRQYLNMAEELAKHPEVVQNAMTAVRETGMEPTLRSIRGGTDGARLTERGVPTPNIFTGGQNLHGRYEWIALPAMVRAARTLVNLVGLFAEPSGGA